MYEMKTDIEMDIEMDIEANVISDAEIVLVRGILIDAVETLLMDGQIDVMVKGRQDIVTNLDYEMERRIKDALLRHFPNDRFIGEEENHETLGTGRTWVCDPIDGTLNFTQSIPYYGVQLALMDQGEPVMSMIYLPVLGEFYHAVKGRGAYLGEKRLLAPKDATLENVIVTFGDFSKSNPSSRGYQLEAISALVEKAMRIRIQGASSVDFAFVTAAKNGCHIIFSKNLWEMAPGTMLAQEAGCKLHRIDGKRHGFEGEGLIIAINEAILSEVASVLEAL